MTMPDATQRMTPAEVAALAPKKRRQPEKAALAAVDDLFRLNGWRVDRIEEDMIRGTRGLPDRLYTSPIGLQLWVEGKRPPSRNNPRGRVRAAQIQVLAEFRHRKVPCCVVDDVEQLRKICAYGKTTPIELAIEYVLRFCDELMVGYEWWPA